jgi:hypothetical protein
MILLKKKLSLASNYKQQEKKINELEEKIKKD